MTLREAFILSGGLGERLMPLTKDTPKTLLEIKGKTVLEWNIINLINHGVEKIVLGLGEKAEKVQEFVEDRDFGIKVFASVEQKPLGTGGALKLAQKHFSDENFAMCNGDEVKVINYTSLFSLHAEKKAFATLSLIETKNAHGFGLVNVDQSNGLIKSFKEKPTKPIKGTISAGAYILNKKVFDLIPSKENYSIEVDVFPKLSAEKKLFGVLNKAQWFPIDTPEKLELAKKIWKGF